MALRSNLATHLAHARASHAGIGAKRLKPWFLETCKPWLPVITTIVGVVTCVSTIVLETRSTKAAVAEARQQLLLNQKQMLVNQRETVLSDWRAALQKVDFDEAALVPTAFLMESFDEDAEHKTQARKVEYAVLKKTEQPEFFDLIFFDLIPNLKSVDDVSDLASVGRSINQRLHVLWYQSPVRQAGGDASKSYELFLRHPEQFYPAKSQQGKLQTAIVLIYELDSFSTGFACILTPSCGDSAHPEGQLSLGSLVLVNQNDLPTLASDEGSIIPKVTCEVLPDAQDGFTCIDPSEHKESQTSPQ